MSFTDELTFENLEEKLVFLDVNFLTVTVATHNQLEAMGLSEEEKAPFLEALSTTKRGFGLIKEDLTRLDNLEE